MNRDRFQTSEAAQSSDQKVPLSPTLSESSRAGLWLFLALVAVYLLSYSGSFHAIDEVSVAAMTESLVKQGTVATDQIRWSQGWTPSQGRVGPDGHLYSKKGIGSALLGMPFYWLAVYLPETGFELNGGLGAVRALMLANALVTALTAWLLFSCVRLLGYRSRVAVLTALAFGLGTMAWPYAKYFFSEPMTALGLVAGLWGLLAYRRTGRLGYAVAAGCGLGAAFLAKIANGATWPLFVVYGFWTAIDHKRRTETTGAKGLALFATAFLAPMLVAGMVLLAYNIARSGQPLDLGYAADETFSTPLWQGLVGLFLSPGKSLFVYSPILLAALFGIPALLRRDTPTALLSLGVVLVFPLLYARWFMWWGGWSWGPRFLLPVLPFLSLFLAPVVASALRPGRWWLKAGLLALVLLGFLVQVLGVAVDFNQYLLQLYQRGIDSSEINFQVALSPLQGHWGLIQSGTWDLAWAQDLASGADRTRLLWPSILLVFVGVGWWIARRARRGVHLLLVGVAVGLVVITMLALARLPAPTDDWGQGCAALNPQLQEAADPGDVMLVDMRAYADHFGLATSLLDCYKAAPAYWGWARQEPVSVERQEQLAALGREHGGLWLLLEATADADPASTTERWLEENAYHIGKGWLSPAMRLVRYDWPAGEPGQDAQSPLNLRVGERVMLDGYGRAGPTEVRAGEVLALSLFWRALQPVEADYVTFVQLLDAGGGLRAQLDRVPVGGFHPTSAWSAGEEIRDNVGLELPQDLEPGDYQLIAGLYSPASMERLPVSTPEGQTLGDYAPLAVIRIVGSEGP